jgi:hypothetical protein
LTWWLFWFWDVFSRPLTGLSGIIATESMPWIFRWTSVVLILWCFAGIAVCFTTKLNRRGSIFGIIGRCNDPGAGKAVVDHISRSGKRRMDLVLLRLLLELRFCFMASGLRATDQ